MPAAWLSPSSEQIKAPGDAVGLLEPRGVSLCIAHPFLGASSTDDSSLDAAFALRDRAAFDLAYERYGGLLYSAALKVLRNREDAQDCVHDVLLPVWKNERSYTTDRGSLRNFLVVCVHNDAISRLRRAARRRELAAQVPAEDGRVEAFEIPDFIEHRRLGDAIASLPPEQRSALMLAYYGGKTHVQIAYEQNEPLGTIKGRLSLAVRRLAKELRSEVVR